jgi:hypothetical protein
MDALSVFQEQSMLLYVIAGLLIALVVIGVGVWVRLGEVRDALRAPKPGPPQAKKLGAWRDKPLVTGATAPDRPPEMRRSSDQ